MSVRRIGGILGVLVMVVGVYLLNRWCVPFGDDWLYALEGENTALEGVARHVTGFADVVRIQLNDYVKGPNGRIFLHSVVTLFCALGWHGLFDVLNTGMWFLLVGLLMRECGIRRRFLACSALVFVFLWQAETCCVNMAFSVNYLWMACMTIVFLALWRKVNAPWIILAAFLFGWSQEAFSLPMVAALGACCLIRSWVSRRFVWNRVQTATYLALVLGTIGCIGSHFLSGRVAEAVSMNCVSLLVLAFWPSVLLGCVGWLIWRLRVRSWKTIDADLEWWLYFAAASGMFALIGQQGLRLAMPMLLAALVICLKHHEDFSSLRVFVPIIVVFSLMWLTAAAFVQRRQAIAFEEMVEIYRKDPQGLTFRRPVATGVLDGTVSAHALTSYYRGILRHICEKEVPPIVLSSSLYEEIMRPSTSNRTFFVGQTDKTGWRKRLPGRLGRMFPDERYHEGIPGKGIEIKDSSGHCVRIQSK